MKLPWGISALNWASWIIWNISVWVIILPSARTPTSVQLRSSAVLLAFGGRGTVRPWQVFCLWESELFPWLKDAFLDEFRQHHMNWLRISAFISVAFPRKLHPETCRFSLMLFSVTQGCLISFSPERHVLPSWAGSGFGSSIELIKLSSQIGTIFLKYLCCWKWRRRERGTSLNSKNFLWCVFALDFQPLLASGVNLDLVLEDEQILKYHQICQKFEDKSLAASNRMWMDFLPAFQSMQPPSLTSILLLTLAQTTPRFGKRTMWPFRYTSHNDGGCTCTVTSYTNKTIWQK